MIPVAEVSVNVKDAFYNVPLGGAFFRFKRASDNPIFRSFPCTSYGNAWSTAVDGVPSEVKHLPNTPYQLQLGKIGYDLVFFNVTPPAVGQTLNVGEILLNPQFSGNYLPDAFQLFSCLPLNVDSTLDPDGDGMSHEAEFIAETNPNDGSSRFLIPDVSPQSNGDVIVAWAATGSRVYTVHRTNHLPDTNGWTIVHTVSAPRSGASAVYGSDSRSEQPLLRHSSFPRILKNRTFSIRRHTTLGYVKRMRYISTRGKTEPMGFMDAVLTGLAPDGGLLIPESIPDVSSELDAWADLNYPDLAFEVFKRFTDIPEADLRGLVDRAYSTFHHPEIAPVVQVGDVYVLELFHGPTLAFKDMAMQFLSQVYDYVLEQRDETINILGATSGDTGSAAIHGVRGKERIRIFMMHPKGRTSPLQEKQMTSVLDDNVFNLAVDGTFDDCQLIMKSIFADVDFKTEHRLGAVNSVNWCRVLAQIVYYLWAGLKVMKANGAERVRFAVPTGNFGNILAGYYA
ncbi:MAG: hypothetical protein ACI9TH_001640, partial [Kiritimatiellia bacterium]